MKIQISLSRSEKDKIIDINKDNTVEDVLIKQDLKPDTVIVLKNDKPIPIDTLLRDGDKLKIIQVSSGG